MTARGIECSAVLVLVIANVSSVPITSDCIAHRFVFSKLEGQRLKPRAKDGFCPDFWFSFKRTVMIRCHSVHDLKLWFNLRGEMPGMFSFHSGFGQILLLTA